VLNWKNRFPGFPLKAPHDKAKPGEAIAEYTDGMGNKIELFASKTDFYGKVTAKGRKPVDFGRCVADEGVNVWLVERDKAGAITKAVWVNIAPRPGRTAKESADNKAALYKEVAKQLLAVRTEEKKKGKQTTIEQDMKAVADALKAADRFLKEPKKLPGGDARYEIIYYALDLKAEKGGVYRLFGTGKGAAAKAEWRLDPTIGLDGKPK
jgi:hypothetical protein